MLKRLRDFSSSESIRGLIWLNGEIVIIPPGRYYLKLLNSVAKYVNLATKSQKKAEVVIALTGIQLIIEVLRGNFERAISTNSKWYS